MKRTIRNTCQLCGEAFTDETRWLHMQTHIPPERPERLQGPEVGAVVIYRNEKSPMNGAPAEVVHRSYVWAPGDPAYGGGSRRYDWKVIRFLDTVPLPPFWGSRALCVDDKELVTA